MINLTKRSSSQKVSSRDACEPTNPQMQEPCRPCGQCSFQCSDQCTGTARVIDGCTSCYGSCRNSCSAKAWAK